MAQMEQRGKELDSWDRLVKKAIDTETKANLQPLFFIHEMDHHCPRGKHPIHTTVAQSEAFSIWDPCDQPVTSFERAHTQAQDEPSLSQSWHQSLHPILFENVRASQKKNRREKKKHHHQTQ